MHDESNPEDPEDRVSLVELGREYLSQVIDAIEATPDAQQGRVEILALKLGVSIGVGLLGCLAELAGDDEPGDDEQD